MRSMDFTNPIIWTFLPTPLALDIIERIPHKTSVYYCIDNFSASSPQASRIVSSETRMVKKADLVFVTSQALYDQCAAHTAHLHKFPFGVNFDTFERARLECPAVAPEALKDIRSPIIGYIGGIHKWIDLQLLSGLALKNPEYSFVLVGPLQTDVTLLSGVKNIHFVGAQEHARLPHFIRHFDVCVIPYLKSEYTKNVYPTKLNEYLAMGKPVISTPLPEVLAFNHEFDGVVQVADDVESFGDCIKKALLQKDEAAVMKKRIEIACTNSWANRIRKMSALIEDEIERKRSDMDRRWRDSFLAFCNRATRKIIMAGALLTLAYLLVFKTTLIWFLASPLQIVDRPGRVDAIVVLGGGVGETGSPGKSTIERARYAAGLYRSGCASKIIFSSGYVYTSNDAENMRLIAVSEGVKNADILLEQKANTAYENVIFVKKILDDRGWRSIALVSAPYNLRRVSLVVRRWDPGRVVEYLPVPQCQFYDRSNGVTLDQLRALFHEYAGIAYYWLQGHI